MLLEELREALQSLILQYQQLTYKDLDCFFDGDTGTLGPEHMLDIMDSFHLLTPIRQFGEIHWRYPCTWGSDIWLVTTQPCSPPFGTPTYVFQATCLGFLFRSTNARQYPPYSITTLQGGVRATTGLETQDHRHRQTCHTSASGKEGEGGQRRRARHSPIMTRARHSPSQTLTTLRSLPMPRRELRDGGAS